MFLHRSIAGQVLCMLTVALRPAFASTGTFDFLTYNVAGLPAFLNGNGDGYKTVNSRAIGSQLAAGAYDVVHMQEDFNFHAYVYETDDHEYRTPTSGGVPFGSGLNTVSNYAWSSFSRVKWNKCSLNSGDCLTPKGFTFMRLELESEVEVDLYNLHADAGSDSGDVSARQAGIEQLLAYIHSTSAGRAVIVAGDTNDRYTNSGVSTTLLAGAGFYDSWVELVNGGQYPEPGATQNPCTVPPASELCETVDKILYRSGDNVTLSAQTFSYLSDVFVLADGSSLSDHNPVHVDFAWSTT